MEILGYLASILIGVSLGMIGSGGSILTVPVLVYLMGINPLLATTSSLFIVGIASLVGGFRSYSKQQVDFKAVIEFGIPSILSIFITRHYLLPALPETIVTIGSIVVSKSMFLMVVFAILMLAASISMIRGRNDHINEKLSETDRHNKVLPLVLLGLFIGVVTGLLGAGGGFLIIPALILFLKLPMKTAVGTSLMIVGINSLFGFLFSLKQFEYNWTVILIFTGISIAGIFIGSKLADKISGPSLKKGFGWFVLVMGIYIIIKEVFIK
ncbi:MAG: sulfite exporter TauE/SafE family protein [Chitinophagaceae bacterium]|nr:sulfite exporter TauE/SafE family protein [Chitinophagaceae bacterium]